MYPPMALPLTPRNGRAIDVAVVVDAETAIITNAKYPKALFMARVGFDGLNMSS